MSKQLKQVFVYAAALILVIVVSISGTLAYLTSQQKVDNTMQYGEIKIDFYDFHNRDNDPVIAYPTGSTYLQPVAVSEKNDMSVPMYYRIKITYETPKDSNGDEINQQDVLKFIDFFALNEAVFNWSHYTAEHPYIYCLVKIRPGTVIPAPFNGIELKPVSEDGDVFLEGANQGLTIKLEGQAIQSSLNGIDFDTAKEAFEALVDGA